MVEETDAAFASFRPAVVALMCVQAGTWDDKSRSFVTVIFCA